MEKFLVVLLALCVVPSIVSASFNGDQLMLKGSVYGDTCLCGYETKASRPLAAAVGKILCTKRTDPTQVTYQKEFVTKSDGTYEVLIDGDFGNDVCNVIAVKSADPEFGKPSSGRDQARVILTRNNGMSTNVRFANAIGFDRSSPLDICGEILKQYEETETNV
ncbi:pollen Ole e 1 allergen and extensin family protein [Striga asiatica]|uniref:Pollen Ole e 1 allergen and extensin family protein n=1 Tax=Striga asiatica TaxID=4170 RepID=A0A5A7QRI2_STRAF|nr:pollen Ole e 1 allergen and extensin family protein [Striga asiatica]